MTEIKFRVWDKHDNEMKYADIEYFDDMVGFRFKHRGFEEEDNSDIVLMQYTGLKDKNGKEIYEGDLLKYDDNENYEVVYSVGDKRDSLTDDYCIGAWMLKDKRGYYQLICNVTRPYEYAEIVGNIYDKQSNNNKTKNNDRRRSS